MFGFTLPDRDRVRKVLRPVFWVALAVLFICWLPLNTGIRLTQPWANIWVIAFFVSSALVIALAFEVLD